jgi:hypothetical protein
VPGLHAREGQEHRRAGNMRAGLALAPRQRVQAVRERGAHELVVGRVVVDLVDAVAEAVVRAQDRRVLVGTHAVGEHVGIAGQPPDGVGAVLGEAAALATEPLDERAVLAVGIEPLERRNLVLHLVGAVRGARALARADIGGGHRRSSSVAAEHRDRGDRRATWSGRFER